MSASETIAWSVRFRRERQDAWTELEKLVQRAEQYGLGGLDPQQLARLPVLYRATASALGVARAALLDQGLRDYLEALTARAYLVVYAPKRPLGRVLWQFLAGEFPAAVRAIRWQVAVSAGVMLLGGAIAFALVQRDLDDYYLFVDAGMAAGRVPTASVEQLRETLFGEPDGGLLTFATMLFTHNATVGILIYGLGFLFGVPVLLLLLYNGVLIGAMSALFHARGLAVEWWSWILPHGVTELLALVLCGAAGLHIGQRVVFPGRLTRLHALARAGRSMGAVVGGSVGMLLLAGLIEGVFRQVVQSVPVRYTLAATWAGLWLVYFTLAGRGKR
ncbi:MAG: stage II sporulation protein M [Planctomycetota bacterium]